MNNCPVWFPVSSAALFTSKMGLLSQFSRQFRPKFRIFFNPRYLFPSFSAFFTNSFRFFRFFRFFWLGFWFWGRKKWFRLQVTFFKESRAEFLIKFSRFHAKIIPKPANVDKATLGEVILGVLWLYMGVPYSVSVLYFEITPHLYFQRIRRGKSGRKFF